MPTYTAPIRRLLVESGIRKVFDKAQELERSGRKLLRLDIGRPVYPMPPGAADGAHHALQQDFVNYIPNRGIPELLQALSTDMAATCGRTFNPTKEIIVTAGASEALAICGLALLEQGDEVIIPEPAWSHYQSIVELAGARSVVIPTRADKGFVIDPEEVESKITSKTRMLVVVNPSNPTGAIQPPEVLQELARLALKHGIFVLLDEAYRHFIYDGEEHSMAQYMGDSELLLYLNTFSKSYCMTGWRIGYVACSARISDALNRVHQYLTVCGVSFAQKGALAVLQNQERLHYLSQLRDEFSKRREAWLAIMTSSAAFKFTKPGGAFYLFPEISFRGMTGEQFCDFMLEEHGISMVPGSVFGENFKKFVRISYGGPLNVQQAAAARIVEVLSA